VAIRFQTASEMIRNFRPRDAIEAMLAGQCVMFHGLMISNVRRALSGEAEPARPATGGTLATMSSAFRGNLDQLRRYRRRPSEEQPGAAAVQTQGAQVEARAEAPAETRAETEDRTPRPPTVSLNRAARRQAARAQARTPIQLRPAPVPVPPVRKSSDIAARTETASFRPSDPETANFHGSIPETIAACHANPEAMAALAEGDAARFAKAMGIELPSEAFLAAALPGSLFDRLMEHPWPSAELSRRHSGQ